MEQSPDYKKLYEEEQQRRRQAERAQAEEQQQRIAAERAQEEAERAQEEAERAQEEAERAQEEAERAQEEAERAQVEEQQQRIAAERARDEVEQRTRETTLPELLHNCHIHLSLGLAVQTDSSLSTQGDAGNADRKTRPDRIQCWEGFGKEQEAIWVDLISSSFAFKRHFRSMQYLQELGKTTTQRLLSSEADLNLFQRITVEDHVADAISRIFEDETLRLRYGLLGTVKFENHGNTLSVEEALENGVQQISISSGRRRSPRLQAPQDARPSTAPVREGETSTRSSARPRADQFCVYNIAAEPQQDSRRIPAFIMEYKAPHKLTLGCINAGLQEMDLDDVVQVRDDEGQSAEVKCRRLVAAVITQAFSYMVRAGLQYGVVSTGEAYIFLRVPEDPRTVYYFLSVPKSDVGMDTGWTPTLDQENRLHLTALGQMLAFTLLALQTRPRPQIWRDDALAQLRTWQMVYQEILDEVPSPERDTTEYRPAQQSSYHRASPIRLRRHGCVPNCSPPRIETHSDHESDQEPEQETPSRPRPRSTHRRSERNQQAHKKKRGQGTFASRDSRQRMQYCTQNCLRGLVDGGLLDKTCPNASHHGQHRHQIDQPAFFQLMQQQLSRSLDHDVDCLRVHGARGVLFRIRLSLYGYTVVAKGTPAYFKKHLQHEARVYSRLRSIQGQYVPVYLGSLDLVRPYHYDGIVELVHFMLISYGGTCLTRQTNRGANKELVAEAGRTVDAIHALGVLHRDAMARNMLWDASTKRVLMIDFERAELRAARTVLGDLSSNRKRKRPATEKGQSNLPNIQVYSQERSKALRELQAG